ncbi:MAG: hypothetical protein IJP62_03295 [Treponema sp.]|nr:hypothetical protein [Treponema sp.]
MTRPKQKKRQSSWRHLLSGNIAWMYSVYSVNDYCAGEKIFIGESLDAFLA